VSNARLPLLPWWAWGVALGSVAALVNFIKDPLPGPFNVGYVAAVFLVNIGMWLVICGAAAVLIWLFGRAVGHTD
jgi:hypothetical protein